MPNTFDWIEIRTHNVEAAAKFYGALFGWKILGKEIADGTDVWIFDTGGEPRLENLRRCGIWLRPSDQSVGTVVYVQVQNIEETLGKVLELGGKVIARKAPLAGGYAASFQDPEGNMLMLYQDREGVPEESK